MTFSFSLIIPDDSDFLLSGRCPRHGTGVNTGTDEAIRTYGLLGDRQDCGLLWRFPRSHEGKARAIPNFPAPSRIAVCASIERGLGVKWKERSQPTQNLEDHLADSLFKVLDGTCKKDSQLSFILGANHIFLLELLISLISFLGPLWIHSQKQRRSDRPLPPGGLWLKGSASSGEPRTSQIRLAVFAGPASKLTRPAGRAISATNDQNLFESNLRA